MPNPTIIGTSQKSSSWPAVTSLAISRATATAFDGMVVVTVVIGRDGSPSATPVITPPAGFVLDEVLDFESDTYPSTFNLYHKVVSASSVEPASYTWGISPARSLSLMLTAVKDALAIAHAANTDFIGAFGNPQHVRDPAYVRSGSIASLGLQVYTFATVSFGPGEEIADYANQYLKSSILNDDFYSTKLYTAGTYHIVVWPLAGNGWVPAAPGAVDGPLVRLHITRTAERTVIGRRDIPGSPVDLFGDTIGTAGTVTDPPIGQTAIESDFSVFTETATDPDEIADWTDDSSKGFTGWLKVVLTSDMWLGFDTYDSEMLDTVIGLYPGTPTQPSIADEVNDDTVEYPYRSQTPFSGNVGFVPYGSYSAQLAISFDYYVQQTHLSGTTSPYGEVVSMSGDYGSPRRVGWTVSFAGGTTITTRWPYIPGTVQVNGSSAGVTDLNPATGTVQLIPIPTSPYTVTYDAAGTSLLGSTGFGSEDNPDSWVPVAEGSGAPN